MINLAEFLALSPEERLPFFEKAGLKVGLPVNLVEKDFWVSFILDILFRLPGIGQALTFKGGTSLSKVYQLIRRFSEDIDITIEKSHLGFSGDKLPERATSNKQRQGLLEDLSSACRSYVQGKLFGMLQSELLRLLPNQNQWKLSIDSSDPDGQTINFAYPTVAAPGKSYVSPIVKIEFGSRGEIWPIELQTMTSYAHSALPNDLAEWKIPLKALKPTRTFWEKATILHMFANYPEGKIVPERQSRHHYDFYCLLQSHVRQEALNEIQLLTDVCNHKSIYFRSGAAKYDDAKNGKLKLVPQGIIERQLSADYGQMSEMIFDEPVEWDLIISTLEHFQKEMQTDRNS